MSAIRSTSCDGCGAIAPTDYTPLLAHRSAWLHLYGPGLNEDRDACSWECLATIVAARIAEGANV